MLTSTTEHSSPMHLSSYDVDRLVNDSSPAARNDVLQKIAKQYRVRNFSAHELALAEQIFRIMMKDVAITVRAQLADEIKDIDSVPRDIVLHLAQDVSEVALPVIEMSSVLSDADLVYLVETSHDVTKLEAVTRRPTVSERVSTALVESNYPNVVESLLNNPNAKMSYKTMETVVSQFARESKIIETLAMRDGLPLSIVEKLVNVTSSALSQQLKSRYALADKQLAVTEQKVREATMINLLDAATNEVDVDALVVELQEEKRLTTSFMFAALARGHFTFFVFALARIAGIPNSNAVKLASDRGSLGFKALYEKSGLPVSMLDAVSAMLKIVLELKAQEIKPGTRGYANALASRLLEAAEQQHIEHMPYMLALIRGGK
jgi:uncharacterized protein (DUF2336 family)